MLSVRDTVLAIPAFPHARAHRRRWLSRRARRYLRVSEAALTCKSLAPAQLSDGMGRLHAVDAVEGRGGWQHSASVG